MINVKKLLSVLAISTVLLGCSPNSNGDLVDENNQITNKLYFSAGKVCQLCEIAHNRPDLFREDKIKWIKEQCKNYKDFETTKKYLEQE